MKIFLYFCISDVFEVFGLRLHRLNVVREYVSLGMHISNIMQCVSPAYGLRSVP